MDRGVLGTHLSKTAKVGQPGQCYLTSLLQAIDYVQV